MNGGLIMNKPMKLKDMKGIPLGYFEDDIKAMLQNRIEEAEEKQVDMIMHQGKYSNRSFTNEEYAELSGEIRALKEIMED
jgi:hypothetical protein